jgi:hypothetical protein
MSELVEEVALAMLNAQLSRLRRENVTLTEPPTNDDVKPSFQRQMYDDCLLDALAAINVIKAKLLSDEVVEAGANILYGFTENEKTLDAKITKQILTAAIAKLEGE